MSPYAVPTLDETSVAAAVERHGRLDVMLNSASVVGPLSLATSKLDGLYLAAVMAVNRSPGSRRVMAPAGPGGSILCMASISGILGGLGTYPYSVPKLIRHQAELCRLGVRINCISPYTVPTLMVVGQFSVMLQGAVGEEHWSRRLTSTKAPQATCSIPREVTNTKTVRLHNAFASNGCEAAPLGQTSPPIISHSFQPKVYSIQAMELAKVSDSNSPSEVALSYDSHSDLLSKLPRREFLSQDLVFYKNYWFYPHFLEPIIHLQDSFRARPGDTILASNPKCGTTWLMALAFTIMNRSCYEVGNHPLLTHHPQQLVPFIEFPSNTNVTNVEKLPSPRLLATHIPFSLLPESIRSEGSRIIYICRDPKDAFISSWHFNQRVHGHAIDFDKAFNMFSEGSWLYGPFWNHCLEYWKGSIERPDVVLFLRYEEVMSDPVKYVKRIATFLGVPFSSEEEDFGVPEEVVKLCSFKMLSGLKVNQIGELSRNQSGDMVYEKSAYFRSGKVGDWVNHMSEEMASRLDHIMEEKLEGSGLTL
nr:unnamed protein product [Digitaria exilis]